MVTSAFVEEGNPADVTLATPVMMRPIELSKHPPKEASFDGSFSSKENLINIKALGAQNVAFSEARGLAIEEMTRSERVYRRMRNFRAGVESVISYLKRTFGLGCCTWRGEESFKAYVHGSVLACNMLILARHLLNASG